MSDVLVSNSAIRIIETTVERKVRTVLSPAPLIFSEAKISFIGGEILAAIIG